MKRLKVNANVPVIVLLSKTDTNTLIISTAEYQHHIFLNQNLGFYFMLFFTFLCVFYCRAASIQGRVLLFYMNFFILKLVTGVQ